MNPYTQRRFAFVLQAFLFFCIIATSFLMFFFPKTAAVWAEEGRALSLLQQLLVDASVFLKQNGLVLLPLWLLATIGCMVWFTRATRALEARTFNSVEAFYKAIGALIADLRANGNEADAARLESAYRGVCTTSSELIGELMLVLRGLNAHYPPPLRSKISDCLYFAIHHRRILGLY